MFSEQSKSAVPVADPCILGYCLLKQIAGIDSWRIGRLCISSLCKPQELIQKIQTERKMRCLWSSSRTPMKSLLWSFCRMNKVEKQPFCSFIWYRVVDRNNFGCTSTSNAEGP